MTALNEAGSTEMPKYVCHKEVHALRIAAVEPQADVPDVGQRVLVFEDSEFVSLLVHEDWATKHGPQPGGYYVVYADGYTSFSPAKAFEDGYTQIEVTE